MPVTNSDSSERTRQRRAMALYAYSNQIAQYNTAQIAAGLKSTVRREQNTRQTSDVSTERKEGGCYCSDLANGIYNFRGGCNCTG